MGTGARISREQSRAHSNYWAQPQSGELTYVALGDSAGVGVGVADPHDGYVGVVAARLGAAAGTSVRTINLSVSGAKARDVLERQLPALLAMPTPDVVTCVIGGNDIAWGVRFDAKAFATTMEEITRQLPAGSVLGLVPHFIHWPYAGWARRANRAIASAASRYGLEVADIYSPTRALSLRAYLRTFARDWFHPNAAGHRLWADAVWAPLASATGTPTN